jgi:hypothetical protein
MILHHDNCPFYAVDAERHNDSAIWGGTLTLETTLDTLYSNSFTTTSPISQIPFAQGTPMIASQTRIKPLLG